MYIGPRDPKSCQNEIEAVEEYAGRVFGVEIDYVAFKTQVREIIHNRINDYVFQRFRDWPIRDLILLEDQIDQTITANSKKKDNPETMARRGRPPKNDA